MWRGHLEPGRAQQVGGGGPGSGVGLQHAVHQQAQPCLVEVLRDRGVRAVGNLRSNTVSKEYIITSHNQNTD